MREKSKEARGPSGFWPSHQEDAAATLNEDQLFEGESDPRLEGVIYTHRPPTQKPPVTHCPFRRAHILTTVSKGAHGQPLF